MENKNLHIFTPLLESKELSRLAGRRVWLKMENMQPGGSFKIRGIGRTMQEAKTKLGVTKFIGSSGGNAGMAMAVAAQKMGMPVTIYIPKSTKAFMIEKLKDFGAEVIVIGENWNEANEHAKAALEQEGTFMIHPYDQEDTWAGHSTIIDEINNQLGQEPGCIVTCVGGGGLAIGILQGIEKQGWESTKVVAMETEGANCLKAARDAGKIVTLSGITSVATSLGALSVSQTLFNKVQEKPERVISHVVTDKDALQAVVNFADHMRVLVEPACGSALSAVYTGFIKQNLEALPQGDIVVIVCGGNIVNLNLLQDWLKQLS